jgi:hypothetical protein
MTGHIEPRNNRDGSVSWRVIVPAGQPVGDVEPVHRALAALEQGGGLGHGQDVIGHRIVCSASGQFGLWPLTGPFHVSR